MRKLFESLNRRVSDEYIKGGDMNRQDRLHTQVRHLSLVRRQREKRELKQDQSRGESSKVKEYVEETLKNESNGTERSDLR